MSSSSSSSRSPSPPPPAFSAVTSSLLEDPLFQQVPQLTGTDNAHAWKTALRQYASTAGLAGIIDATDAEPGRPPSEQRLERAGRSPPPSAVEGTSLHSDWLSWQKRELTAQSAISHSLSPFLHHYITPHLSAKAQWDHLTQRYSFSTYLYHQQLVQSLESLRLPEKASVREMETHWERFAFVAEAIRRDQSTYPEAYVIRLFLESLPRDEEWWLFNKRYDLRVSQDRPWEDLEKCWEIEVQKKKTETAADVMRQAREMDLPDECSTRRMEEHWTAFENLYTSYVNLVTEVDQGIWAYMFVRSLPPREYSSFIEAFDLLKKPRQESTWDAMQREWEEFVARARRTGR